MSLGSRLLSHVFRISAGIFPQAEEKSARRRQMVVVERWLLWGSGAVLKNCLRRYLLMVYLMVLYGVLLLMPRHWVGSRVSAV